jgi:hypothetical protein
MAIALHPNERIDEQQANAEALNKTHDRWMPTCSNA